MNTALARYFRREPSVLIALGVLVTVLALWVVLTPGISASSITITISQKLPLVFVAIGQLIVIVVRGIDLSVGGTVALVNVIIAAGTAYDGNVLLWTVVALLAACVVGVVNGLVVAYLQLPALIVTLATLSIVSGVALSVLPTPGGTAPDWFSDIPLLMIGPVPLGIVLAIVVPMLVWLPIRRSRLGTALYAVGGDAGASFVSGIAVRRTTAIAYVLSAFFAGVGGVFVTMVSASGDPNIGTPFTLNSIAAAVLGGALLAGGRGTVVGAIAGAFILSFITNVLFVLGVSSYWQYVVSGGILIAALAVPYSISRVRLRRAWK